MFLCIEVVAAVRFFAVDGGAETLYCIAKLLNHPRGKSAISNPLKRTGTTPSPYLRN